MKNNEAIGSDSQSISTKNNKNDSNENNNIFASFAMIVLDEADRLATNTDLCQQVNQLVQKCQQQHQQHQHQQPSHASLCLCSATWPSKVNDVWRHWMFIAGPPPTSDTDKNNLDEDNGTSVPRRDCVVIKAAGISIATRSSGLTKSTASVVEPTRDNDQEHHFPIESGNKTVVGANAAMEEEEKDDDDDDDIDNRVEDESKDDKKVDWCSRIPPHVTQVLHVCAEHKKARKLLSILQKIYGNGDSSSDPATSTPNKKSKPRKQLGVVFFGKIKTLQYIHKFLIKSAGSLCRSGALHSQLKQHERQKALNAFSSGRTHLLLATDLVARGIHIDNVSFVVQYDFPSNLEQYIHRCGRAGRKAVHALSSDKGNKGTTTTTAAFDSSTSTATVYSFFTRNLQPLANDMVALLEANQQWVDPNLRALATTPDDAATGRRAKKKRKQQPHDEEASDKSGDNQESARADLDVDENDNDGDDMDEFPELSGKRIVLKRASHVD